MRTPGRCTNHDHCWLGNARRDVWVPVDQDFICPVCASPLKSPPIRAISMRSAIRAGLSTAAMLLLAGGAGFGLVRAVDLINRPAPDAAVATAQPPASGAPAKVPGAAGPKGARSRGLALTAPAAHAGTPSARQAGPVGPPALQSAEVTGELAAHILVTHAKLHPAASAAVAAAKPALPVTFGRPPAPEDSAVEVASDWHSHSPANPAIAHAGFTPDAGVITTAPSADGGMIDVAQVSALTTPAQGDADEAAPRAELNMTAALTGQFSAPAPVASATPSQQDDRAASLMAAQLPAGMTRDGGVPAIEGARGGARFSGDAGGFTVAALGTVAITHLFGGNPTPTLPPARVDATAAQEADAAPNPIVKLVTLPAAKPDALAKPDYPDVYEAEERSGTVHVQCTITERGAPDGCVVLAQQGGVRFTSAVLSWLDSGKVRYRPGLQNGRVVPEPRHYAVHFEP